jgi:trk system potassium uptake protein
MPAHTAVEVPLGRILKVAPVLGAMAMTISGSHLAPLATAWMHDDGMMRVFAISMGVNFVAGLVTWLATRRFRAELRAEDGFLLVVLAWTGGAAFAAVPLLLGIQGLSFTDGYFEAASALTTTGATVLVDLDTLAPSLNLWRHMLQWFGGMGIIVLAVAILPLLRVGGMQVYKAETPGPMKEDKLTPRIRETAKKLWILYVAITIASILALRMAGMSWFDAVCHAFSAVSLGGFSTHDASVGHFDSVAIEVVLTFIMIFAALNFATHFVAWRSKAVMPYLRDAQARWTVTVLVVSFVVLAGHLYSEGTYETYWTALRHVSFNLVSIATDCGYASVDFDKWPALVPMWMLFLSCMTASAGSTGGGIKMIRWLVLLKQAYREMLLLRHPAAIRQMKISGAIIENKAVFAVLGFIAVYFMSVMALTFILMASGLDFVSSFSAIIACINNMGPGLNQVGPAANYQALSDFQSWVCVFAMVLGRLELFTLLMLFTPAFWRR